ncbi:MAG TPA: choline dehydrogenase [Ktedonobacteraceae bacterium]|nr:choline dehydrogenase [Ktedonobacteraceae bacterium]
MYDYIIVGAGSAGCVLANRLTEDPQTSVLLIEAGGPDKKQEIHIPAAFSKLFKTPLDWEYYTEEEPRMANRKMYWPRGKVLGGSSSINAMIYIRGHRHDYDSWRDEGNEGWGYADVLPYFKKAENQERGPSEYHGVGGPLNVSDRRYTNPLSYAFVAACKEMGIPENSDFNGAVNEGAGLYQTTQKNGARWSTVNAYLTPALSRPNLTVRTDTQVARVVIENGRATGIAYIEGDKVETVRANREVLVCGGAINSPQILMLSGVGPAEHLRSVGIEVIADLPGVGENLQDHLVAGAAYQSTRPISLNDAEKLGNILTYLFFKRGPFTSTIAESGGFIKTQSDLPAPDIQYHFAPAFFREHGAVKIPGHGFTIGPTLLHPRSRGRILLHSNDPLQHAAIHANYLSEEEDIQSLLAGLKLAHELAHTKAFAPYLGPEMEPQTWKCSDKEMIETICQSAETIYHPAGTCKMGSDAMAVVDTQLRVRGIEGLRVIDASIMPTVVGGNTNAPTIMIAEKAADMLKRPSAVAQSREKSKETV